MAAEWAQQFYSSTHWKKCRDGFISYKRGLCERCLAKGIIKPGRDVHHKRRLTPQNITDPNIALSWDNLELLCRECHEEEHNREKNERRRFTVDAFGRVIESKDNDEVVMQE